MATSRIHFLPLFVLAALGLGALQHGVVAFSTSHRLRPVLHSNHPKISSPKPTRRQFYPLAPQSQQQEEIEVSSPLKEPALATLDILALLGFAAIGKASHAPDGSIDPSAVFVTAFPFITAWLATSPVTGTYESLATAGDDKAIIAKDAAIQTVKGWALAIPLGCALRGIIKGYVPPLPFVIVTLIATLVILGSVRVIYALATTAARDE